MLPTLQLGPLSIQTPGLILLAALWIGVSQAGRHAPKFSLSSAMIDNITLVALLVGIVGGRASYVLQNLPAFTRAPLNIIALNPELFDVWGGLLAAALAVLIYTQRKGLGWAETFDALTPAAAVVMVGLGLSHLAAGSAYGRPTDLPWGLNLWGVPRHPTQVYETLLALGVGILIWPRDAGKLGIFGWDVRPGGVFWGFVALSALARIVLESFLAEQSLWLGWLPAGQVIAWGVLALGVFALGKRLVFVDDPLSEPTGVTNG